MLNNRKVRNGFRFTMGPWADTILSHCSRGWHLLYPQSLKHSRASSIALGNQPMSFIYLIYLFI